MKGSFYILMSSLILSFGVHTQSSAKAKPITTEGNECDSRCDLKLNNQRIGNTATFLGEVKEGDISVFLDEGSNDIIFQLHNATQNNFQVKVFNILGEALIEKGIKGEYTNVSVYSLEPGVYFLTLFINDKPKETLRVVRN